MQNEARLDWGLAGPVPSPAPPASTTSSPFSTCSLNSGSCSLSVPWVCQAHCCILNCWEHWLLLRLEFHVSNIMSKRPSQLTLWRNLCPQPFCCPCLLLVVYVCLLHQGMSSAALMFSSTYNSLCGVLAVSEWVCELCVPETGLFPPVKHFNIDLLFLSIVVSRHVVW